MRQAYVGIASHLGLESFYVEQQHTSAFLMRRAARKPYDVVCFWAVMSPEIAVQIRHQLIQGQRANALLLVQSLAYELGRILPETAESEVLARW